MKILVTGKYEPDYNRTKIILDGLKTIESLTITEFPYKNRLTVNYFKLRRLCKNADVIFIPAFCHQDVPLIKSFTNKPIVFDPLISRYLSKVFDYKLVKTNSFRAKKNFYKDKISMSSADIVLCDTDAHKEYYQTTFKLSCEKLKVVEVGVNTEEFEKAPVKLTHADKKFIAGFYGSFVPLQGVKKIIDAAHILKENPEIEFRIIGAGFEYESLYNYAITELNLSNIKFLGWVKYEHLYEQMKTFDVALGIFGDSLKADLVIPNKIYHYAAMGLPIISRKSKAITEVFYDRENIFLTDNNAEAIAKAINELKADRWLRNRIGANVYNLISKNYNHKVIGQKVYDACKDAVDLKKN